MEDLVNGDAEQGAARALTSDGPKPSPRALAAWEALFEKMPSAGDDAKAERDERRDSDASSGSNGTRVPSVLPDSPEPRAREALGAEPPPSTSALAVSAPAEPAPVDVLPAEREAEAVDRPASLFHVYDWVVDKLRARPSTTYRELCRLGELGNFSVAEGHYKRARRQLDDELPNLDSRQIDALIEDTLQLIRAPLADLERLRAAAAEIATICGEALDASSPDSMLDD